MQKRSPLPEMWKVPEVFRRRVRESVGRQRAMLADGHLLLVLHEPPRSAETHRNARFFWRSPDGTWQSNTLGPGVKALQKHIAQYADVIEQLDELEGRAEMADDYFRLLREIAPLHRAAGNMHDALQEARDMIGEDHDLIVCRDQAYHVYRATELLQSDAKIGLDCATARRAEEDALSSHKMAVAAHRINVLAAIFFPIVTIATIFGMNLTSGLEEAHTPWLFWVVLLAGVTSGFLMKAAIMERPSRPRAVDPRKRI